MNKFQRAVLRDRPPGNAQEAMASLCDPAAMVKPPIRDRIDAVSFEQLAPPLVEFMRAFKAEMAAYKIPMAFMESWRSEGRQHELKAQGVSLAAGGQSPHQYGLAVDIVHAVRGWKLTPVEWAQIGAIGYEVARKRKIAIEWGGEWKFYDPAHWQLREWRKWKAVLDVMEMNEARRPDQGQWADIAAKVKERLTR